MTNLDTVESPEQFHELLNDIKSFSQKDQATILVFIDHEIDCGRLATGEGYSKIVAEHYGTRDKPRLLTTMWSLSEVKLVSICRWNLTEEV